VRVELDATALPAKCDSFGAPPADMVIARARNSPPNIPDAKANGETQWILGQPRAVEVALHARF
jgi:hypothetical protein